MATGQVTTRIGDLISDGKSGPPPFVGSRFNESGRFLRERGNTVVSHVLPGSDTEAALLDIRARMMALPHAHHFAFTAPTSLHMTVAQGVLETRRRPGYWPDGVDLAAPVEAVTELYLERFASVEDQGHFAVRVEHVSPYGIVVAGASPDDERTLRRWRDHLIEPFGYRHPEHDDYEFHITIAYLGRWLPPEALDPYVEALQTMQADLKRSNPVLELGRPALCSFEDMNHFEPLLFLR